MQVKVDGRDPGLWWHLFAHAIRHMGGWHVLASERFSIGLHRPELLIRLHHTALAMGRSRQEGLIGSCRRSQGRVPHAR